MPRPKKQHIEDKINDDIIKYYGEKLDVVQIVKDPKVPTCYVVRINDPEKRYSNSGNWCFVVNYDITSDIDYAMIEDTIELDAGHKITKKDFGDLRFI